MRRFFAWSAWLPIESTSTCDSAPAGIVATVPPPATGVLGEEASAIVERALLSARSCCAGSHTRSFTSRAISSFGLQREARRRAHRQRAAVATPQFGLL
jgi:hypothetical protein